MIYIGVDPGAGGGMVALTDSGLCIDYTKMPATERDQFDWFQTMQQRQHVDGWARAALEHVWSIPGQGGAFKFGKSVGHLEAFLIAVEIPFDQVLPKKWQSALGVHYAKGLSDVGKKNLTKRRAQQLFPTIPMTHAIADAFLLAEYVRRLDRGMFVNQKKENRGHGKNASVHREEGRQAGARQQAAEKGHRGKAGARGQRLEAWGGRRAGKRAALADATRDGAGSQ